MTPEEYWKRLGDSFDARFIEEVRERYGRPSSERKEDCEHDAEPTD